MDVTLAQIINELVRDTQVMNGQAEQLEGLRAENAELKKTLAPDPKQCAWRVGGRQCWYDRDDDGALCGLHKAMPETA